MSKMSFLCYIQNGRLKSGIITAYLTANDEATLFSFFSGKVLCPGFFKETESYLKRIHILEILLLHFKGFASTASSKQEHFTYPLARK